MSEIFLFWMGGVIYQIIEILWRGHTHWSMFFAGGFGILIIDGIFNTFEKYISATTILILCGVSLTCIEFLSGCIFNICLKKDIWDYSQIKGNILGQICPIYTLYWSILSIPAILYAQFIRTLFY